jgi:hypothetical protein
MAVYVDDAEIEFRGRRWSHMVAETADELHAAAAALGIPRRAAQAKGRTLHYDLPTEYRERAVRLGVAIPITTRELVRRRDAFVAGNRRLNGRLP